MKSVEIGTTDLINVFFSVSDIDECASGILRCEQNCVNTAGGAYCACDIGYEVSENNKTCTGR